MSGKNKRIAFQGDHGAFSDLACRTVFKGLETVPCETFEDAFRVVQTGKADLAMIPVDNTIAGRVAAVHHLMPEGDLYIVGEHFEPIRHMLLGVKGAKKSDIKHVHSHIHALPQCSKYTKKLGLKPHVHADTAGAARDIAARGDKRHAAIASSLAARIYGLDIIAEDIQNEDHNTTRFLILSSKPQMPKMSGNNDVITTLTFEVRNIPAALYKSLGGFATNGVNMLKLESYVDPRFQAARFYADVEGHPDSKKLQLALEELRFFAKDVKYLGTYKAHPFRKAKKSAKK